MQTNCAENSPNHTMNNHKDSKVVTVFWHAEPCPYTGTTYVVVFPGNKLPYKLSNSRPDADHRGTFYVYPGQSLWCQKSSREGLPDCCCCYEDVSNEIHASFAACQKPGMDSSNSLIYDKPVEYKWPALEQLETDGAREFLEAHPVESSSDSDSDE